MGACVMYVRYTCAVCQRSLAMAIILLVMCVIYIRAHLAVPCPHVPLQAPPLPSHTHPRKSHNFLVGAQTLLSPRLPGPKVLGVGPKVLATGPKTAASVDLKVAVGLPKVDATVGPKVGPKGV